jgi:t-SNARE complex subunit (syntaxin)
MTHRAVILLLVLTAGCSSAYYATMEKLGWEKRDLLVSRVEAARDSQNQAKTEFKDALEQFRSVVKVESGELEERYDKVRAAYEDADARATDVRSRVAAVESVGGAHFSEWNDEIEGMKDAGLRTRSRQLRKDSLGRYERMLAAMKKAEGSMTPVLDTMRDQVTFMKHNLNAKAVNAMRSSLTDIEGDVGRLLQDMERSIAEADAFISDLGTQ